jgi:hypothetical protein
VRVEHAERQHDVRGEPWRDAELADQARLVVDDRLVVLDDRGRAVDQRLVGEVRRRGRARDRRQIESQASDLDVARFGPPDREVRITSTTSRTGERLRQRAREQRHEQGDRDPRDSHPHV